MLKKTHRDGRLTIKHRLVHYKYFSVCSDRTFTIDDTDVGEFSAVKIRLVKKGLYEDYWQLRQVGQQKS